MLSYANIGNIQYNQFCFILHQYIYIYISTIPLYINAYTMQYYKSYNILIYVVIMFCFCCYIHIYIIPQLYSYCMSHQHAHITHNHICLICRLISRLNMLTRSAQIPIFGQLRPFFGCKGGFSGINA